MKLVKQLKETLLPGKRKSVLKVKKVFNKFLKTCV
jgi:hypothetical protein